MKYRYGKYAKTVYYMESYAANCMPRFMARLKRRMLLSGIARRHDWDYISDRVDYYCKDFTVGERFMQESTVVGSESIRRPKVYWLDSLRFARCYQKHLYWKLCWGDVNYIPPVPSISKSRPIGQDNGNAVIMNLNYIRHFIFVKDDIQWRDKQNMVIFRGAIGQKDGCAFKENRYRFMEMYFSNPMCDLGEVMEGGKYINPLWAKPKISIPEHLKYKFVMALEGNDVASNLKWIMSSNSIAVMPRPRFETWFMEGRLVPDYHYIEINDDFSDMPSKLQYYIEHPDKAELIISHAHEYVAQFKDSRREDRISMLVMDKYFRLTNPGM